MPIRRFSKTLFSDTNEYRTFKLKAVLISSSGGAISNAGGYTIHTITSIGSTNFSITGPSNIDYLIVAGGGSGNQGFINATNIGGGGGGAGGYLTGTLGINSGAYSILVGSGGVFVANLQAAAANGTDSSAFGLTSIGGGGGGMQSRSGASGGSGGGGGGNFSTPGGSGTAGQGNAGGPGSSAGSGNGGGGGGAGTAGQTLTAGSGSSNSISGSSVTYATGGTGGLNGTSGAGSAGAANTGNGGQGGQQQSAGGNGGSGIVILRYITEQFI